ncbi:MAG: oligosaccharide flippase family protein [Candidatus Sulfotelmatobacter sp.]
MSWRAIRASKLARNTFSMLTGGAITTALQAAYFVMIARSLGPGQYGAFIGVAALIAVLSPFSAMGVGTVLVKDVSRDRRCFPESLGNALLTTGALGLILLILVLIASPFILSAKVPVALVCLVGVSDLIFGGLVSLASLAFQALEMLGKTALVRAIQSGIRALAALVMLVWFSHPSAVSWAVLYLGGSIAAAAYALWIVFRRLGYPRLAPARLRSEMVEGLYFSIGVSSTAVYNNMDKPLLVRLGTLDAAGFYGIAYRVVDFAFQPVGALQASAFSKYFQHGSRGITNSVRYARRLLLMGAGYGIVAGVALFFGAPLFPYIFGRQFAGSEEVLRWLSPLVFLRACHYCYSNAMTGADFQGLRNCIQVVVAVLNVALNIWLIPRYSWRGAAWASLVSDGLLVLSTWAATLILSARIAPQGRASGLQPENTA